MVLRCKLVCFSVTSLFSCFVFSSLSIIESAITTIFQSLVGVFVCCHPFSPFCPCGHTLKNPFTVILLGLKECMSLTCHVEPGVPHQVTKSKIMGSVCYVCFLHEPPNACCLIPCPYRTSLGGWAFAFVAPGPGGLWGCIQSWTPVLTLCPRGRGEGSEPGGSGADWQEGDRSPKSPAPDFIYEVVFWDLKERTQSNLNNAIN